MGSRARVLAVGIATAGLLGFFQNCAKDIPADVSTSTSSSGDNATSGQKNCTSPTGVTVLHGASLTLFKQASPTAGQPCVSEVRNCSNGILSGTFTIESCSTTEPTPAALAFPEVLDAGFSAVTVSAIKQVTGFTGQATVSIVGSVGEYRTCNDSGCATVIKNWTKVAGPVANGKYLQLRQTSAAGADLVTSAVVKVGNAAAVTWRVLTYYKASVVSNATNLDLKTLFTAQKWTQNVRKVVVIPAGVKIGSTNTATAALRTNTGWAGELTLQVDGAVEGAGGAAGAVGGSAILVEQNGLKIINNGAIRAGGGGGGTGGKGGNKTNTTSTREPAGSGQNYEWSGSWKYGVITEPGDYGAIKEVYWAGASIPPSMAKDGWTYHRGDAVKRGGGFLFFCFGYPSCWYEHKIYRTRTDTSVAQGGAGGAGGRGQGYNAAAGAGALGTPGTAGSGSGGPGGGGGTWGMAGSAGGAGALSGASGTAGGAAGYSLQTATGITRPAPTGTGQLLGR